jgi:hypothetical protein
MCEICRQTPCHPRCPNYIPPNTSHYCSFCQEGIYDDEEYVENENHEYAHYDCLYDLTMRNLIEWLGFDVEIMKDEYD